MPLLCRLLGHKMVLHKNHTHLWYVCSRCRAGGWHGARIIRRPR